MEVLRVDLRPRVASELRALRDAGAIPAGATLWRRAGGYCLATAPAWYGRRETRHLDIHEPWRVHTLPDGAHAPTLRALLDGEEV